jgi:hypothetical protein
LSIDFVAFLAKVISLRYSSVVPQVIIYDEVFLFFKKKYLRYFDVKTSSAHEGTNFGLKEHAAAVLPSHKIDVAGKKLSLQSSMKGAQMEAESTYMACSQSLWSLSPTANHVTTLAESIISRTYARTHDYSARRTALGSWEVHFVGDNDYYFETDRQPADKNSPIPIFMRIREVILQGGFLSCDCGGQQRIGLTCVHTMTVMESCFPDWKGPAHHDVSPRWWVIWVELAHKPKNQTLTSALLALMENEVPGPRVPGPVPVPPADSYSPVTSTKTARNRVKNYSREQLDQLVPSRQVIQQGNAQRTITTSEGLTQESYIPLEYTYWDDQDKDHLDEDNEEEENLFGSSLLDQPSHDAMASARDILKPHINDVLQCLDTLNSKDGFEKATKVLNDLANELRLEIGTSGRKRNIDNCRTVNINVEENVGRKSRTFASRNC